MIKNKLSFIAIVILFASIAFTCVRADFSTVVQQPDRSLIARTISNLTGCCTLSEELIRAIAFRIGPEQSSGKAVSLRTVKPQHPRIWLDETKIRALRERYRARTPQWARFQSFLSAENAYTDDNHYLMANALGFLLLKNDSRQLAEELGKKAVQRAMSIAGGKVSRNLDRIKTSIAGVAIAYDWCHELFSSEQREQIISWLNAEYDIYRSQYRLAWHNYNFSLMLAAGLSGYATYGENPRAQEMIEHARLARYESLVVPAFKYSGRGGGWAEGDGYGRGAATNLIKYALAVKTATGEDLFDGLEFYRDRMRYEMFASYPSTQTQDRVTYVPRAAGGDGHRKPNDNDSARSGLLILMERYSGTEEARLAQAYLKRFPELDRMVSSFMAVEDFLWYNPQQSTLPLERAPLSHFARGTGTVTLRSDWTPDATWIRFQCGDHFEGHQHLEQNSFAIWKRADLAIDSGVYDWWGSSHAVNYYSRTIAHNSILVFAPEEDFRSKRGGLLAADSANTWARLQGSEGVNDGGQRAWRLYDRSGNLAPDSQGNWKASASSSGYDSGEFPFIKYKDFYDTGDITRFEDSSAYAYIVGDATNAYSRWKVERFVRRLVYLRPVSSGAADYLVIFDDVIARDPSWQKSWLLHSIHRPQVEGDCKLIEGSEADGIIDYTGPLFFLDNGSGRLFGRILLPHNRRIRLIGGIHYDSWVNGVNYYAGRDGRKKNISEDKHETYGRWRIEVQPVTGQKQDRFLHVLMPTTTKTQRMPDAEPISSASGDLQGALIKDEKLARVVMFYEGKSASPQIEYKFSDAIRDSLNVITNLPADAGFDVHVTKIGADLVVKIIPGNKAKITSQGVLGFRISDGIVRF